MLEQAIIDESYFEKHRSFVSSSAYSELTRTEHQIATIPFNNDKSTYDHIKDKLYHDSSCLLEISQLDEDADTVVENILFKLFGCPLTEQNPLKKNYSKIKIRSSSQYYATSSLAQPLHTDQGHMHSMPRYLALWCHVPSLTGGESTLFYLSDIIEALNSTFGDDVKHLYAKDAITIHAKTQCVTKPLLFLLPDGRSGISFSTLINKISCSSIVSEMYRFIVEYVHNPINQVRFNLKKGELLLIDNSRCLHARLSFPNESRRCLYRYWFQSITVGELHNNLTKQEKAKHVK